MAASGNGAILRLLNDMSHIYGKGKKISSIFNLLAYPPMDCGVCVYNIYIYIYMTIVYLPHQGKIEWDIF
jgi:hypothetical protein